MLSPQAEGALIPLGCDYAEGIKKEVVFHDYFIHGPWRGSGATTGLTEGDADFIDRTLGENPALGFIRVDRERLRESHEAWVRVLVREDTPDKELSLFSGFGSLPLEAILTWQNSD